MKKNPIWPCLLVNKYANCSTPASGGFQSLMWLMCWWSDLKKKLSIEGYVELSEKIGQVKMVAPDGKQRVTDCY